MCIKRLLDRLWVKIHPEGRATADLSIESIVTSNPQFNVEIIFARAKRRFVRFRFVAFSFHFN